LTYFEHSILIHYHLCIPDLYYCVLAKLADMTVYIVGKFNKNKLYLFL